MQGKILSNLQVHQVSWGRQKERQASHITKILGLPLFCKLSLSYVNKNAIIFIFLSVHPSVRPPVCSISLVGIDEQPAEWMKWIVGRLLGWLDRWLDDIRQDIIRIFKHVRYINHVCFFLSLHQPPQLDSTFRHLLYSLAVFKFSYLDHKTD